MIMNMKAALL